MIRTLIAIALGCGVAIPLSAAARPRLSVTPDMKDYPSAALAAKETGVVLVQLVVRPDGQLRCTIPDKASSRSLARASCELVVRHWVFLPGEGKAGTETETITQIAVNWVIRSPEEICDYGGALAISPERWITTADYPQEAARDRRGGLVIVSFDIMPNGRAANCVIEKKAFSAALNNVACRAVEQRAAFLPAIDAAGQPMSTKGRISYRFIVPERPTS